MATRVTRSSTMSRTVASAQSSGRSKPSSTLSTPANVGKKRKHSTVAEEEPAAKAPTAKSDHSKIKSQKISATPKKKLSKPKPDLEAGAEAAAKILKSEPSTPKSKANQYNLSPGQSPYPDYERPTPEECQHVYELLSAIHGKVSAPKTIPAPNLQSSGCGEVPSVLDALVRTRLSAATNNANSNRAFRGLVEKFGIIKEGIGKGSVNWNKVRLANVKDVFEAIKTGGLADVKSRDIQKILQMVYEENKESDKDFNEKNTVLSLDHLHQMSSEAAFDKLIGYPGVGPKTASCVLLFCMQRPSFAVDTHVFRLTSWIGWVPGEAALRRMGKEAKVKTESGSDESPSEKAKPLPPVTRNTTYAHLDVRIPDHLKYPLHYLFIRHGKHCPYCAAKKDGKIREEWGDKKCPLAALKSGKKVDVGGGKKIKEEDGFIKAEFSEEEKEEQKEEDEEE